MMNWKLYLMSALLGLLTSTSAQEKPVEFRIEGEVPDGWEVVESVDAPMVEKWVELKSGEKKKVLLRSFVLRPIADKESKFSVVDPLKISSGQKIDDVLFSQNENLTQTQDELSTMLQRLRALLATLPTTKEAQSES